MYSVGYNKTLSINIMTVEEYFNHLKVITENAGADKTGVKLETEDGYCISISVTKKQNKK